MDGITQAQCEMGRGREGSGEKGRKSLRSELGGCPCSEPAGWRHLLRSPGERPDDGAKHQAGALGDQQSQCLKPERDLISGSRTTKAKGEEGRKKSWGKD